MDVLERLSVVDIAAGPAEQRVCAGAISHDVTGADEENAMRRCLGILVLKRRAAADAALDDETWTSAEELVARTREKAVRIIEENWPAVERVAAALAAGEMLNEADIDRLMEAKP